MYKLFLILHSSSFWYYIQFLTVHLIFYTLLCFWYCTPLVSDTTFNFWQCTLVLRLHSSFDTAPYFWQCTLFVLFYTKFFILHSIFDTSCYSISIYKVLRLFWFLHLQYIQYVLLHLICNIEPYFLQYALYFFTFYFMFKKRYTHWGENLS